MVKKAAQAIPNQLLRRARLERGWTQQVVADRIGAPNDMMVTRWERGKAFPSPYYVERLCQLFELKASDLGLLKDLHPLTSSQPPKSSQPQPSSSKDPAGKKVSPIPPPPRNAPTSPLSYLPLIGREADARVLRDIYQAVQQGQMQVVTIQGEAGIGKTHLASAFLSWAVTQGATLLQGRAFEMGGRLPYQPLVHALSPQLEAEPAPETLLSVTWLSELSRILPQLHDRYPHLPVAQGDETTARIRLFEAVTRLLQAFCKQAPVVLFIDDVHWADAASLDVLHYAGQRWSESGTPLLLLLSLRSEALATTAPLSRWLSGLYHDLSVTDLTLGPWTQDETLDLLASLAPSQTIGANSLELLTELGQWLFRETRGQPFYLVETLNVLLERQILTFRRSSETKEFELDLTSLEAVQEQSVLAPNVRRLILSQLERLPPQGRALVRAGTILGQRTSFDLLCRLADLEEDEALVALDEVLGLGLLREASEEDDRSPRSSVPTYLVGHDKMREVIYTEMGEAHRRLLHRRAFSVCEMLGRPAAELAHHALAAGLTEKAVRFSLAAGEEAVCIFANAEAYLHYNQALEVLAQLPETLDIRDLRVETLLKLVQIFSMAVNVEQTLGRLAEAEDLAQALPNRGQLAQVHYWIAYVYGTRNAMRQAREYAQHVLMEAQELGDEELVARASVQLSRFLIVQGDHGPIEKLLTPVIPVLERTANWLDWTYAQGFLGIALAARGHYAMGVSRVQRALEHAHRTGDARSRSGIVSHLYLSHISLHGGDPAQMLSESRLAVEEAERVGDRVFVYIGHGFGGWALSRLSQHEEGIQSMERAQAASQQLGGQLLFQDTFAAVRAELSLAAGRVEESLARAEAVVELANEVGGVLSAGLAQRVWGQALAHLSRWEEAEMHFATSVQTLLAGENLLEAARTQVAWGLLCHGCGDLTSAQEHFEHAATQFKTSGLARELETVNGYLAQIV